MVWAGLIAAAVLGAQSAPLHAQAPAAAPTAAPSGASCCGPVTPQGQKLITLIDSMQVETYWQAKEHVDWVTGHRDRPLSYKGPGSATHCSAFAAAVGQRLGVYMLRPPQHGQVLLASAQTVWFRSPEGVSGGWKPLDGATVQQQAQQLANQGNLVVIAYESPDPHTPGHIVVVRPADKSAEALAKDGPEISQAGTHNYNDSVAAKAFVSHPGAWPSGVRYYWHSVGGSK